jgi:hypothetical protein
MRRSVRHHAWALLTTVAYLLMTTFFVWDLIDEDSFPRVLFIPLLLAAAVMIGEAVAGIITKRRGPETEAVDREPKNG